MNFADYIIVPLELITWFICSLVKKLFKKHNIDTSYIPYVAVAVATVLAITMHYTSDLVAGNNIWEVIVIGIANGFVAVGINEAGKTVTTSSGESATVMNQDVDELWEESIDEEERDAEEEVVNDYAEDDVTEVTEADEVDSEEANG